MSENKKIKLLMIPSDGQGVGHFRTIWPAQTLSKYHGDEFDVEINLNPRFDNIEYFKQFDIIHYHRHFGPHEKMDSIFAELRSAGVVLIVDIDDFWEPATTHPLYEIVKREGLTQKIKDVIKKSDYVTTTTDIFAKHIKGLNENAIVIPNALNMNDKMWTSEAVPNQTDKCRISWIGGSSHLHDLKLMEQSFHLLYSNQQLQDKFQIVMCGFDTRGTITEIRPDGSKNSRNIEPHETVWMKFEEIFTGGYKEEPRDPEYFKWLKKIKKEEYPDMYKKNYVRRWTLPLTQYGKHYDYCDVCLAPIDSIDRFKTEKGQIINKVNYFNEVKSELKIIEAGMKRKALIAQDFGIYKELLKDGETGILIKDNKDGWYKAMKKVIENPEYRQTLADNLHNFVREKYDLKNVTAQRAEIYKNILKERQNKEGHLNTDGRFILADR